MPLLATLGALIKGLALALYMTSPRNLLRRLQDGATDLFSAVLDVAGGLLYFTVAAPLVLLTVLLKTPWYALKWLGRKLKALYKEWSLTFDPPWPASGYTVTRSAAPGATPSSTFASSPGHPMASSVSSGGGGGGDGGC